MCQHQPIVRVPVAAGAGGAGLGVLSAFVPPSYDEAFWISIAGMLDSGRTLYVDAIDNKTVAIYAVFGFLDSFPGRFELARGLAVASILAVTITCLGLLLKMRAPWNAWLAVAMGSLAALLGGLVLTKESIALALLLASMVLISRDSRRLAVALALFAAAFDLRIALLYPGLIAYLAELAGWKAARRAAAAVAAALVGAGTLLVIDADLRFGLVEMNAATRPTTLALPLLLTAFIACALPLIALSPLINRQSRILAPALLLAGALVIGFASLQPFPHYWAYLVLPVAAALRTPSNTANRRIFAASVAFTIATVPWAVWTIDQVGDRTRLLNDYEALAALVTDDHMPFVDYSFEPYVAAYWPRGALLRAPTADYVILETSRARQHRAELPELLRRADAVVDAGFLGQSVERLYPPAAAIADAFDAVRAEFPCELRFGSVTLHLKSTRYCDSA